MRLIAGLLIAAVLSSRALAAEKANVLVVTDSKGFVHDVVKRKEGKPSRVEQTTWHESQVMRRLPDGSVEVRLLIAEPKEIRNWILGWGKECEVMAPAELRVPSLAHDFVAVQHHGADQRIGLHPAPSAPRELERPGHRLALGHGRAPVRDARSAPRGFPRGSRPWSTCAPLPRARPPARPRRLSEAAPR